MKRQAGWISVALLAGGLMAFGQDQSTPQNDSTGSTQTAVKTNGQSAGHDVGSGSADVGKGAAKGAGSVAEGAGKGTAELVTLHPVNAAGAVGMGAAKGGKNVAVGTAKGTGKIVKGTGKALKKVF